jgi:hypothetical protein
MTSDEEEVAACTVRYYCPYFMFVSRNMCELCLCYERKDFIEE